MSETTTTETPKVVEAPNWPERSVTRNGVSLGLKNFMIVKGDRKGSKYLAPKFDETTLGDVIAWVGNTTIAGLLQTNLKKAFQDIFFDEALVNPDTGEINWDLFDQKAADFTAVSMKMKEIVEKIEELQGEIGQLISTADMSQPAIQAQIKQKNADIQSYFAMKEQRSRKKNESEEPQPAVAA